MTFWHPLPRLVLGSMLALASLGMVSQPASALPLIGVGANVGVGGHWPLNNSGPALSATADVDLFGTMVGLHYWNQFATGSNYMSGHLRKNLSPVPMISLAPGIGGVFTNGAAGPLVNFTAGFSPLLLPASAEVSVGAAYVNASMLLPYSAGIKLSLIPFTAFALRYRGWAGAGPLAGVSGPEVGLEVGF